MKLYSKLFFAINFVVVSSIANAAIMNVYQIKITPSVLNTQGWLQVSEVVATEKGTGNDLALASSGATTSASSTWPTSSPDFAIDGVGPSAYPNLFHSNENDGSSFLNIFLDAPSSLDSVSIFGRTGICCSSRDFYNLFLFDFNGNQLFSALNLDGTDGSVSTNLTSVPVPAAVWLFGWGFLGLLGFRKKII